MKLNGWKRIGIVASVLWMLGAGIHTFNTESARDIRMAVQVDEDCISSGRQPAAGCDADADQFVMKMLPDEREDAAFVALAPVPFGWGFVYLVLFVVRWVGRGFAKKAGGVLMLLVFGLGGCAPKPKTDAWTLTGYNEKAGYTFQRNGVEYKAQCISWAIVHEVRLPNENVLMASTSQGDIWVREETAATGENSCSSVLKYIGQDAPVLSDGFDILIIKDSAWLAAYKFQITNAGKSAKG